MFDGGEPLTVGINSAKFRIPILAAALPSSVVLEVIDFVVAGPGGIMLHVIFLYHVDGFAVEGVLLGHAGVDLVFILCKSVGTFPTPGCL